MSNIDPEWVRLRSHVLNFFQAVLLGKVDAHLRAVTVSWSRTEIRGVVFYHGVCGDLEREIASVVETEVMAHFPDHEVSLRAERLDEPEPYDGRRTDDPGMVTTLVYARRESWCSWTDDF